MEPAKSGCICQDGAWEAQHPHHSIIVVKFNQVDVASSLTEFGNLVFAIDHDSIL